MTDRLHDPCAWRAPSPLHCSHPGLPPNLAVGVPASTDSPGIAVHSAGRQIVIAMAMTNLPGVRQYRTVR